jgi:Skp family chaperone for outer membrane proteins
MQPPEFESKRQELEKKLVDLQQSYVKLERELAQDRTKLIQDLLKAAEPKIAAIARAEGVTMILDQSTTVWIDPAANLTDKLIAEMK